MFRLQATFVKHSQQCDPPTTQHYSHSAQISRHRAREKHDEEGQTVNHPSHPSDLPCGVEKTTVITHPWHRHRRVSLGVHRCTHTWRQWSSAHIDKLPHLGNRSKMTCHLLPSFHRTLITTPHHSQKCQRVQQMAPTQWDRSKCQVTPKRDRSHLCALEQFCSASVSLDLDWWRPLCWSELELGITIQ